MRTHSFRGGVRLTMGLAAVLAVGWPLGPAGAQAPSGSDGTWVSPAPWDASALHWTRSDGIDDAGDGTLLNGLAVGEDGRVLLVGGAQGDHSVSPMVWGSSDGLSWSRLKGDLPKGSVAVDVLATDPGFLVVTRSDVAGQGRLFRSDGTTLAPLDTPDGDLAAIERSPAGWHALGGADAPTVWTSADDGVTWESAAIASDDAVAQLLAVTDDGTIVALGWVNRGDDARAATAWASRDGGATWTATTLPVDAATWRATALAWTPIGLMARVIDPESDDDAGVNLRSLDGIAWEAALETPGWGSLGTVGSEAIVFGTDAAWHSRDGHAWTEERWPTLDGFDIAASHVMPDRRVVAVGTNTSSFAPASFVGTASQPAGPTGPSPSPSGVASR